MHPGYFPVLFWSLLIFASFWGYGELLRRRINRPEFADIGWGLTAAWGMAVVLAIGGVLMALHLAKAPNLTVLVLFGASAALYYAAQFFAGSGNPKSKIKAPKSASPPSGFRFQISTFILFLLAGLAFASSIAWPLQIDPNDDVVCYLFYPEKILQTGTLIEPFNVRRMGTYGGQALLQALVMIVGGEKNGHVPDRGFGMLILFGMLLHLSKGIPKQWSLLRFLAVGCLFFVSVPRINTGSSLTGAAMILALLITLSKLPISPGFAWRTALTPSLLLAATGSLRPTYLLCAAAITSVEPILRHLEKREGFVESLRNAFSSVWPVAACTALLLVPWMSALWQSNGTAIFPPFRGTINPEFTILGNKEGAIFDVAHAFAYLLTPEVLVFLFCFALAGSVRNGPLALAAVGVSIVVTFLITYSFGVNVFLASYRYTFPILMPVAVWLIVSSLKIENRTGQDVQVKRSALAMASIVLALVLAFNIPSAGRELVAMAETLPMQVTSNRALIDPSITKAPEELQGYAPVGSKIFAAVDTPYAFNFSRNTIFMADIPGASSIGKWPFGKGPTALNDYLAGLGFNYIIAPDFDNSMLLYTRKLWLNHPGPEWFYKETFAKYFLDFMDSVDALAKTNRVVARSANLRLIEIDSDPAR